MSTCHHCYLSTEECQCSSWDLIPLAANLLATGGHGIPVALHGLGEEGLVYRTVVIPKGEEVSPENIWKHGQNDFQEPLTPCRSLMVGDIVCGYEKHGKTVKYRIESQGFTKLN